MMRPKYHDLIPGDFGEQLAPYDFVELKYDGLYAELVGGPGGWSIHGRNGDILRCGYEPTPECYLRGEMIEGTEWSKGSAIFGCFVVWDCIYGPSYGRRTAAPSLYSEMRRMLADISRSMKMWFHVASSDPVDNAQEAWGWHVIDQGCEGLIFRSADGMRFGRMKRIVTQDYVVTGFKTSGPRVTALHGGLHVDGRLCGVCSVPVKAPREQAALWASRGSLLGLVFEAKGNALHRSGALRHGRQAGKDGAVKWRTDKAAKECVL
jgi:hypothetical protein